MRYDKTDIHSMQLTDFMEALGQKPVKSFENLRLYYAPHRNDTEPMFVVNTTTNQWYDHATNEGGDIIDLARLKMNPKLYKDPQDFILKYMNEYKQGKEMLAKMKPQMKQGVEPTVIKLDIRKLPLTEFMKALGQERPIAVDGSLRIYNAPYAVKPEPTMVINVETNLWRDTKSGAYGGIYDLAYELTGSCNMSELNRYIAGEMSCYEKRKEIQVQKPDPPKQEVVKSDNEDKPKRRMRL